MKTLVHNKYKNTAPAGAVYIGRGSGYGNPFVIGKDGTREEVCAKFEKMLMASPEQISFIKRTLKGKHLVCFCAPKKCHGDILARIANT